MGRVERRATNRFITARHSNFRLENNLMEVVERGGGGGWTESTTSLDLNDKRVVTPALYVQDGSFFIAMM